MPCTLSCCLCFLAEPRGTTCGVHLRGSRCMGKLAVAILSLGPRIAESRILPTPPPHICVDNQQMSNRPSWGAWQTTRHPKNARQSTLRPAAAIPPTQCSKIARASDALDHVKTSCLPKPGQTKVTVVTDWLTSGQVRRGIIPKNDLGRDISKQCSINFASCFQQAGQQGVWQANLVHGYRMTRAGFHHNMTSNSECFNTDCCNPMWPPEL